MNDVLICRRTFLSAAGAAVLTAAEAIDPTQTLGQQPVPNSSGTDPAKLKAPAGAADCHIHIYDPRFPQYNSGRASPKNATVSERQHCALNESSGSSAYPFARGRIAKRTEINAQSLGICWHEYRTIGAGIDQK